MIGKRQIRIAFSRRFKKPNLTVRGGCNIWRSRFEIRKGQLSMKGRPSGTKMACAQDPDPWLQNVFRKGLVVRTRGDRLILTRPAASVRLVLERVSEKRNGIVEPEPLPEPEPRVTTPATMEDVHGKSYESISVIGHDLGATALLGFSTGHLLRWDDEVEQVIGPHMGMRLDCNGFGGEYRIEEGSLVWTDVIQTLMLCEGSQEEWLADFLIGQPEIGMDGTDLVLRKNGIEIVFAQTAA